MQLVCGWSAMFFLVGMPMMMTTAMLRRWVFGAVLCRVFYTLTCINMFTGAFTLMLMSADRFAAVWYPVSSARYRTPSVAAGAAVLAWLVSGALMSPVVLYAEQVASASTYSCVVDWPNDNPLTAARAYVAYTAAMGFLLPVSGVCVSDAHERQFRRRFRVLTSLYFAFLHCGIPISLVSCGFRFFGRPSIVSCGVCVFYALLVTRLRSTRRHIKSMTSLKRQPKARRSVTYFVAVIVAVFVGCWLPYWCFQVRPRSVHGPSIGPRPKWPKIEAEGRERVEFLGGAASPLPTS